jgi:uncharacterized membrane protein YphA (DoxX/SURF4 family)
MSHFKGKRMIMWVLQILVGVLFILQGYLKLSGKPEVVENFQRWGYQDWFLTLIGTLEILGGLGLLVKMTARWAASGLALLMLGAAWTHISNSEGAATVVPLIVLVLLLVVACLRWPKSRRAG